MNKKRSLFEVIFKYKGSDLKMMWCRWAASKESARSKFINTHNAQELDILIIEKVKEHA